MGKLDQLTTKICNDINYNVYFFKKYHSELIFFNQNQMMFIIKLYVLESGLFSKIIHDFNPEKYLRFFVKFLKKEFNLTNELNSCSIKFDAYITRLNFVDCK